MGRKIFSCLLILIATILIASCSGATTTQTITETQNQTLTQTETLAQNQTTTQTQAQTQNQTITETQTHTISVTTKVYTSEPQNETTTTTTTTTETSPSTATTTSTTETQAPGNFTTYTSAGLFSISYPSDWELLNYLIEDLEVMVQDVLLSIDSSLPLSQASYIFAAGLPTDLGWEPGINIVVESLPFPVSSLDEAVDAEIAGIQAVVDTYIEISRTNVAVGGREATILYWEGIISLDSVSNLQMFMLLDNVVWIITCTPPLGEYNDWEDDFYNIINSFRYLK